MKSCRGRGNVLLRRPLEFVLLWCLIIFLIGFAAEFYNHNLIFRILVEHLLRRKRVMRRLRRLRRYAVFVMTEMLRDKTAWPDAISIAISLTCLLSGWFEATIGLIVNSLGLV